MEQDQQAWLRKPQDYADKKTMNADYFQALALVAIADALHRVAQAIEVTPPRD